MREPARRRIFRNELTCAAASSPYEFGLQGLSGIVAPVVAPFSLGCARSPCAVIVSPRFDRYQEVSRTIMRVFSDFSPRLPKRG